jgi:hypothetical protein
MMVAAPEVLAAPIDTASEVARIETAAQERTKVLLEPRRKLEEQFKAALKMLGEKARATEDVAGELAALRAVSEVEAGTLAPGKIGHPGVASLAKIHAVESRKLLEAAEPGLRQVRAEKLSALQRLAIRLGDSGMFQDAKLVAPMIAKAEEEAKSPPLEEVAGFVEMPASMRFRGKEGRVRMIELAGGMIESEEAVLRGLRWLKETQNEDGSWTGANQCGMTGFALLALFGHGESPSSPEFGETCLKGIQFLVRRGKMMNGVMSSSMEKTHLPYEHAIATQALAEALIFCENESLAVPGLRDAVFKSGQFIVSNQQESGGWDYGYRESGARGGDLSVTSWQIGALAACLKTGVPLRNLTLCMRKALDYVEKRQGADGGFGYSGRGDIHSPNGYHTLTGAGMLCLQEGGRGGEPAVRSAFKYLEKKSRFHFNGEDCDLYGQYYESLALRQRGGEFWKLHQARVMPQLIENQLPDGSWKAPGGGKKPNAVAAAFTSNVHYRNCLCILILQSYYRIVPE